MEVPPVPVAVISWMVGRSGVTGLTVIVAVTVGANPAPLSL